MLIEINCFSSTFFSFSYISTVIKKKLILKHLNKCIDLKLRKNFDLNTKIYTFFSLVYENLLFVIFYNSTFMK